MTGPRQPNGKLPTLLLIHGVGDVPNRKTRQASEALINPDGAFRRVAWCDWNEAIERPTPLDPKQLAAIARATRLSARLEYPNAVPATGARNGLRRLERAVGWIQLVTMAAFVLSGLWLGLAWAATVLHEEPLPLEFGVGLKHMLFPPLDPFLLELTIGAASEVIVFAALALGLVALMQLVIATAAGPVPFVSALRAAVLDLSRPLLAILTVPGPFVALMFTLAGGLALLMAFFSRPAQVVTLEGETIFWGGDRLGIFLLPVALGLAGLVGVVVDFLLRGFLKVVSDLTRYLGDPEYRAGIHAHLKKTLASMDGGPVIVVGHSLGSVIAVDSLLAHPDAWSKHRPLGLVTCGSPLRRFFQRFFSESYEAPDALARRLEGLYGSFHWNNVSRRLDYVGGRLGTGGSITETRIPQRHHLHVKYWTDSRLVEPIAETARSVCGSATQSPAPGQVSKLPLDRFRYGALHSPRGFQYLSGLVAVAGVVLLIAVQTVWVPRLEKEHLRAWLERLKSEGADLKGELCPQRELDTTGDFPGFQRAVAGIRFQPKTGAPVEVPAYWSSRPDIDWDEVQKAVFGRVPSSAFITGLRYIVFQKDPLLEIRECRAVSVRYARSDPRVFRLPPEFHGPPTVGVARRGGRILLLLFMWMAWCGLVYQMLCAVLGVSAAEGR